MRLAMMPRKAGFKMPSAPYLGIAHRAISPKTRLDIISIPQTAAVQSRIVRFTAALEASLLSDQLTENQNAAATSVSHLLHLAIFWKATAFPSSGGGANGSRPACNS